MNPLMQLPLTPEEVASGKVWYFATAAQIHDLAHAYNVPVDVTTAVVAAISPGQHIGTNLQWAEWMLAGGDLDHAKTAGLALPYGLAPFFQATDILQTGDVSLLTGPKRLAFYTNLRGDMSAITLDTWAVRPFQVARVPSKGRTRERILAAYRELAEHHNMAPAHAQAAVWIHLRGRTW